MKIIKNLILRLLWFITYKTYSFSEFIEGKKNGDGKSS